MIDDTNGTLAVAAYNNDNGHVKRVSTKIKVTINKIYVDKSLSGDPAHASVIFHLIIAEKDKLRDIFNKHLWLSFVFVTYG